jgi:hypothetical protein
MTTNEGAEVRGLKNRYMDSSVDQHEREHCFYRYWMSRFNGADSVDRAILDELLVSKEWVYPLGDIVLLM